mgnify:CR=1 FL=1
MSEVSTMAELASLNDAEVLAGYRHGLDGLLIAERHKDKGYTHGYLNGLVDSGRVRHPSDAQRQLARAFAAEQGAA